VTVVRSFPSSATSQNSPPPNRTARPLCRPKRLRASRQQAPRRRTQRSGHFPQNSNGNAGLAALNFPDVPHGDTSLMGQRFLRQTALNAQRPHVPRDHILPFAHNLDGAASRWEGLGTIVPILQTDLLGGCMRVATLVGVAIVGFIIYNAVSAPTEDNAGSSAVENTTVASDAGPKSKWGYSDVNDELHGSFRMAILQSDDTTRFDADILPGWLNISLYEGGRPVLDTGTKSGYFSCAGEGDRIYAKFDDGPVETYACEVRGDDPRRAEIIDAAKFIDHISRSQKLILEPAFISNGRKRFTFTTGGLEFSIASR
jgi:hypothetical protein